MSDETVSDDQWSDLNAALGETAPSNETAPPDAKPKRTRKVNPRPRTIVAREEGVTGEIIPYRNADGETPTFDNPTEANKWIARSAPPGEWFPVLRYPALVVAEKTETVRTVTPGLA